MKISLVPNAQQSLTSAVEKEFEHDVPHPVVSTKQVNNGPFSRTDASGEHMGLAAFRRHRIALYISVQVEAFLSTLVNDTAIAELQLQVMDV
jgi:hypothetical protein